VKICSNCKINKSKDDYHKRSKSLDKLDYWCKLCKKKKEQSYNFKPNYEGNKDCKKCHANLNKINFYKCKRNPDGLENRCKNCCIERSRNNEIITRYGIDQLEYEQMFKSQKGKCKICNTSNPGRGKNKMSIDHCHKTGKIRGLLCNSCNNGLGMFKDDPELLVKAMEYLSETF